MEHTEYRCLVIAMKKCGAELESDLVDIRHDLRDLRTKTEKRKRTPGPANQKSDPVALGLLLNIVDAQVDGNNKLYEDIKCKSEGFKREIADFEVKNNMRQLEQEEAAYAAGCFRVRAAYAKVVAELEGTLNVVERERLVKALLKMAALKERVVVEQKLCGGALAVAVCTEVTRLWEVAAHAATDTVNAATRASAAAGAKRPLLRAPRGHSEDTVAGAVTATKAAVAAAKAAVTAEYAAFDSIDDVASTSILTLLAKAEALHTVYG
jgi:hypothetical protein